MGLGEQPGHHRRAQSGLREVEGLVTLRQQGHSCDRPGLEKGVRGLRVAHLPQRLQPIDEEGPGDLGEA
eukprot:6626963-Alexandrium_andersonii.AAC.1